MTNIFDLYPVLSELPEKEVKRVLANSTLLRLPSGSVAFEELNPCIAFPFVLTGLLRVVKRSENAREMSLYEVSPGDACLVSSACLLGHRPYNAIALVKEECELVMVPLADFEMLMQYRAFRDFVFGLFSKRVLNLMRLIDEVTFGRLDQRLAKILIKKGPILEASHQALADELGTVREIISRTLSGFSDRDLVRLGRGKIEVLNAEGLASV